MNLDRIVVGVDGSMTSAGALDWALGLAAPLGSEVVIVHAVGLLAHLGPDRVVPADSHRTELADAFAAWCAAADHTDVPHRRLLVDGSPAIVIPDVARKEHADLVILGSRGMGRAPWRVLGSTAQRVAQLADRPVLIVPSDADADPEAGRDG